MPANPPGDRSDDRADRRPAPATGPNPSLAEQAASPSAAPPRSLAATPADWSRHAPRGPGRWPRRRSTRRSSGRRRWNDPGCPSASPPCISARPRSGCGPRPRNGPAASARKRVCPAHRRHGHHGVGMIGRGHNHRVDVLLLVQHDAEVLVLLGPRVLGKDLSASPQSTSHRATMFSPLQAVRLLWPMPAMPTPARLSFSLGGVLPGPPSTCRGTITAPAGGGRAAQESPACNRLP